MFADLDESIRLLLVRHVPLDAAEVDVNFEAPDREWSGRLSRPTVNCFLYDVRENLEFRETDYEITRNNGTATKKKAPIRINATYQVTVWARAPEDEHRLLWRVLSALARHPILPDDIVQGALKEQPLPVPARAAQPDQLRANPADFWQAVDNRIRPALTYVVTLALDPEVVITSPVTFTRVARVRDELGRQVAEGLQILGRVRDRRDSTRVVSGAVVRLRETGAEVTTDDEGRFTFPHAPRGEVTLVVRAPGRREVARTTDVPAAHYDVEV